MEDSQPRAERERLERVYGGYAHDPRKQRAWQASNPGNAAIRRELLDAALAAARPALCGGEVLDAGCGGGYWLRALAGLGAAPERLHGVDLLPERVAAGRAAVPRADIREADVGALPFDDASFDVVLLFTVLSSLTGVAAARRALAEASRVSRGGGTVLIYEPRLPAPRNRDARRIPLRLVRDALGPFEIRPLTVWPPLARRLGRRTDKLYPKLATQRWATSHRLLVHRRPA